MQAGILNVKLKYILKWNDLRNQKAKLYLNLLKDVKQIEIPKIDKNAYAVFHLFVIRAKKRDQLKQFLSDNYISTGIHYPKPLPFLKAYKYLKSKKEDYPISYKYHKLILSLPIYPEIEDNQIKFICKKIKEFYN